jgi:hypothetical protein
MKQERQCIFANNLNIDPDPNPCSGEMTRHHTLYKCEGGANYPTVDMCEGHQYFIHGTNEWGDENFDELIPKTKQVLKYK